MEQSLAFQLTLDEPFEKAVEIVTAALKVEGFGVLTEVDVKQTFKTKLDVEFEKYVILGGRNTPLKKKVLRNEPLVGLLIPCNVTVREADGKSEVAIINPKAMLAMDILKDNQEVLEVAQDAGDRLQMVAEKLNIY